MEAAAKQKSQEQPVKETNADIDELLARKAKKEELRRKRIKRASLFWLVIFFYFSLIVLAAFFIYKATGLSEMFRNLNKKATLVANQERPMRGVVYKSVRHPPEPTSEETAVIPPPVPNVVVLTHSGRMEGPYYRVYGQIQNIGTAAAIDVMVTATFYDSNDAPVGRDTDHVWRKVNMLQPNQKYDFKNILPCTEAPKVTKYDLAVKWY